MNNTFRKLVKSHNGYYRAEVVGLILVFFNCIEEAKRFVTEYTATSNTDTVRYGTQVTIG